ncbi:MAG TPA: hypothetical protein VMO26_10325 [Vicinamibacterales bacterium]|nr:hypothetical protein [Vicinamibacterales bacterium]
MLREIAVIVILSVVWVAYRTIEQARASNQWTVHTQEVLTASETVLTTVMPTTRCAAMRRRMMPGWARTACSI